MNIANLTDLIPRQLKSKDGEEKYSSIKSLTDLLGIDSLLIHYEELAPQLFSARPHSHTKKDEVFIFTKGSGTLIVDGNRSSITAGNVVGFKAVDGEVHVIENTSSEVLQYISIATNPGDDVVIFS